MPASVSLPVLRSVKVWSALCPTVTLPKSSATGASWHGAALATPVTVTACAHPVLTVQDLLPALSGRKRTVTVRRWPAASS